MPLGTDLCRNSKSVGTVSWWPEAAPRLTCGMAATESFLIRWGVLTVQSHQAGACDGWIQDAAAADWGQSLELIGSAFPDHLNFNMLKGFFSTRFLPKDATIILPTPALTIQGIYAVR